MATLEKAPTSNFWSTSLNGAINDSVTTITLNSTTGLQAPGRLVINRQDSTGKNTPSAREVISFTGISGSDLTGVTRGADNSTARSHADGSLVESAIVVGNWDALYKVIDQEHNADGTHDTSKVAGVDGWVNSDETWTYDSATTITVPSGATSKYQKGDKIKLTQTTVKYFYIVGVADTLLTITGGSDYTLTDATITDNYYSKVENPQGFPQWFNQTAPTYNVIFFDDGSGGQPTTSEFKFTIKGTTLTARLRATGTKAGTNDIIIGIPTSSLPAIDTTKYTGRNAIGITHSLVGSKYYHAVVMYQHTTFYGLLNSSATDNETVTEASMIFTYEI